VAGDNKKQLKEAKALISEKNVPKNIKILNRIFLAFLFSLLCIYIANFWIFTLKNIDSNEMVETSVITYSRHSMLAETNYYSRMLNLAAK
jgi:hypothetical protein